MQQKAEVGLLRGRVGGDKVPCNSDNGNDEILREPTDVTQSTASLIKMSDTFAHNEEACGDRSNRGLSLDDYMDLHGTDSHIFRVPTWFFLGNHRSFKQIINAHKYLRSAREKGNRMYAFYIDGPDMQIDDTKKWLKSQLIEISSDRPDLRCAIEQHWSNETFKYSHTLEIPGFRDVTGWQTRTLYWFLHGKSEDVGGLHQLMERYNTCNIKIQMGPYLITVKGNSEVEVDELSNAVDEKLIELTSRDELYLEKKDVRKFNIPCWVPLSKENKESFSCDTQSVVLYRKEGYDFWLEGCVPNVDHAAKTLKSSIMSAVSHKPDFHFALEMAWRRNKAFKYRQVLKFPNSRARRIMLNKFISGKVCGVNLTSLMKNYYNECNIVIRDSGDYVTVEGNVEPNVDDLSKAVKERIDAVKTWQLEKQQAKKSNNKGSLKSKTNVVSGEDELVSLPANMEKLPISVMGQDDNSDMPSATDCHKYAGRFTRKETRIVKLNKCYPTFHGKWTLFFILR